MPQINAHFCQCTEIVWFGLTFVTNTSLHFTPQLEGSALLSRRISCRRRRPWHFCWFFKGLSTRKKMSLLKHLCLLCWNSHQTNKKNVICFHINIFYLVSMSSTYFYAISVWPAIFSSYGQNFDLKKEGIIEKMYYERRAYESVDDIRAYLRLYL